MFPFLWLWSQLREIPQINSPETTRITKIDIINKNMLGWFLPVMCKDHTQTRPTILISRNL